MWPPVAMIVPTEYLLPADLWDAKVYYLSRIWAIVVLLVLTVLAHGSASRLTSWEEATLLAHDKTSRN